MPEDTLSRWYKQITKEDFVHLDLESNCYKKYLELGGALSLEEIAQKSKQDAKDLASRPFRRNGEFRFVQIMPDGTVGGIGRSVGPLQISEGLLNQALHLNGYGRKICSNRYE